MVEIRVTHVQDDVGRVFELENPTFLRRENNVVYLMTSGGTRYIGGAMPLVRLAEEVENFHNRFPEQEQTPSERVSMLTEEVGEYAQAVNKGDLGKAHEELADVIFVALGTLQKANAEAWLDRVREKNERKTTKTHEVRHGKVVRKN